MPEARIIIRTYMALAGLYTLAASLIWSVNTLFLLDAGLSIGEVFLANALFSVGMVAFEIPTGVVADTLGRRVSYLTSVAVLASSTVLYLGAAQVGAGVAAFAAISLLMGLGFTFFSGALESWLVDALRSVGADHQLDRTFARGQQVNGAAMFVGTISGGLLGQVDLALPFVATSALLAVLFVIALSLMVETGFQPVAMSLGHVPAEMRRVAAVGIDNGWRNPGLRLLMLAASIRGVFFGWAFYASQPYFLQLLERDAVWVVGLVTAGVSLATIVGNQIVSEVAKRCAKRSTMLIWASAVATVAGVGIGLTSSFTVAVSCLLIVAGAMGVIAPVRQAYLHHVTSSEHRATVVSFDAMVGSVGGVGGQIGLGAIADQHSFGAGYVVGGATTALALPLLLALRRLGGDADRIVDRAAVEGTCPAGLPTSTHVESHPIPSLAGGDGGHPAERGSA
jgi:MFS family permease